MSRISDWSPTPKLDEREKFAGQPTNGELLDETTGEQHPPAYGGLGGSFIVAPGGMLYGNGGCAENPMAFPGYDGLYIGSYANYRWMLQHPILQLVRAIATADILCNKWEFMGDNDKDVKLIDDMMQPLRLSILRDFYMRGRDFGWQGGELIWEMRDTTTWLSRVKPLLVDRTKCTRDNAGDFSGLFNHVSSTILDPKDAAVVVSAPYKAWKYTYDSEAGSLYGRSWLENVRMTAWRDWLDCAQQLQRLGAKITGIQLILTSPAGTFPGPPDSTGKATQVSYRETCEKIIKALANGAPGAWLPSMNIQADLKGNLNTAKIIAELAQKSLISADLLDHGTTTPAIEGLLKRMTHAEESMFAGGLRPAGAGRNGENKSNTEEFIGLSSMIAQVEDQDVAVQCQPIINAALVLNRGEKKRNTVRMVPPSIVDNKRAYFKAILLAAMNDPQIAREILRIIKTNEELENIDIRIKNGEKYDADRIEAADEKLNTNKQPNPQGGRPPQGEGNPKARP